MQSVTPECTHSGLGSSAFARRYLRNRVFFLFLRVLRCFSSPGCLLAPYFIQARVAGHDPCWVPPFGDLRIEGRLRLPGAYRSLPRPSSPVGTKAFTVRPYLLHHIAKAVTTSTIPQSPFVTYCIVSLLGMHVYLVFCSCCSTTHFVGKRLLLSNRFLCHADVNFRFPSIIDFAGGPDRT